MSQILQQLLQRRWLLPTPQTAVQTVRLGTNEGARPRLLLNDSHWHPSRSHPEFLLVRDDLLHPLVGGNKLRKLDGIIPSFEDRGVTDVVTCGGSQSAHTVAVAVACAERGLTSHLLLRGEPLKVPTGYNLLAGMFSNVTYVPRDAYADRDAMLAQHSERIAHEAAAAAPEQVCLVEVVREGASNGQAVLGLIRLVEYLAREEVLGSRVARQVVIDSGTGTTATGFALGVALLGLPWHVVGVMLAGKASDYNRYQSQLLRSVEEASIPTVDSKDLPLEWVPRLRPRRFGKVLPGEIDACRRIAQSTGVLLDPIYTLAGWEVASEMATDLDSLHESQKPSSIVLLHTGGTMGLFGLGQRFPNEF